MKPMKDMTHEEFCVNALYLFALDVNQFGHEVAAEMLISLMKARTTATKPADKIYPPDNYSICSRTGADHLWGGAHCRHCDIPWPVEYRNQE